MILISRMQPNNKKPSIPASVAKTELIDQELSLGFCDGDSSKPCGKGGRAREAHIRRLAMGKDWVQALGKLQKKTIDRIL